MQSSQPAGTGQESAAAGTAQLLTFMLDQEVYGTDISQIQEVLEYRKITSVPKTPDALLGVINLRGQVVPVLDLRRQFNMTVTDVSVNTCIVIVDVCLDGEKTPLGILADAVKEVLELPYDAISAPPKIGSRIDTQFISGMGAYNGDFIIILNLPRVLGEEELSEVLESIPNES